MEGPPRSMKFGITYHVEDTENGSKKYHFTHFTASKKASEIKVKTTKVGDYSVFQTVNGVQEELKGIENVFDERNIDRTSNLDKAVKVSEIVRNIFQAVGSIIGANVEISVG